MKRPLIYLGLAIIIAAAVFALENRGTKSRQSSGVRQFFSELDTAKIARIEIEHLLDGVELVREGDGWVVREFTTAMRKQIEKAEEKTPGDESHSADAQKVQESLRALKDFATTSRVSTNPEKQATYQVNELAHQVRAYDASGKLLAHVYIGKQGPDFFSTYIRKEGESDVYLTREALGGRFPVKVGYWQEKVVKTPPWLKKSATKNS